MRHSEKFAFYRKLMFSNTKSDKLLFREYYKSGVLECKDIELKKEYAKGKISGLWLAGTMTLEEYHVFLKYIQRFYRRMVKIYIA